MGVTVSTRREPIHEASQVVRTTAPTGSSTRGCVYSKGSDGTVPNATSTARVPAVTPVPTTRPSTAPKTPTMSPSRATPRRTAEAVEPMSRSRAMVRVRPAMMVANVLDVTMAPTYTAITIKTKATTASIRATVPLAPVLSSAERISANAALLCSSATPNAALRPATVMLGMCSRRTNPFIGHARFRACSC